MGYKNTNKQRNKKKPIKDCVKEKTQRLNHTQGTPLDKKLIFAQKMFYVQKMLKRTFRKYNLLISHDDADYFSSEDDLSEGFIMSVLKKRELLYPNGCENWNIMYKFKSHGLKDNQRFFCYCNLSNNTGNDNGNFDKFEYITWKEEV